MAAVQDLAPADGRSRGGPADSLAGGVTGRHGHPERQAGGEAVALTAPAPSSSADVVACAQTILIGFADALAAPETAWSLLQSGRSVVAFARRGSRPPLRRARGVRIVEVTPPEHDAQATVDELRALLAGAGGCDCDCVMPLDDAAVWVCDQMAQRGGAAPIVGPTGSTAAVALDKRRQLRAARRAGLAVPATIEVETADDLLGLAHLPTALKPALPVRARGGRLGRGAGHVCGTRAELERVAEVWQGVEPLLAQPLITGLGEGLFGLAGEDGLVALSAHRRLRMMNPQGSGSSACISIPVDPDLAAAAARMLSEIGWRGLFMLEFLRDAGGTPWFMELNGRTWGSMALARRQGLEYPAWAVDQLSHPAMAPAAGGGSGIVCRHLGRELVHLLMVMRGPKSEALTAWPSRRQALRDVLRVRRTDRWYNLQRGDTRLFVADTLRTVSGYLPGRRRR